jgi:Proteasome subunit A N-terminal signature
MYLTRSEYDRGVNTFSPEGRLFQVCVDGAVLAHNCRLNRSYINIALFISIGRIRH